MAPPRAQRRRVGHPCALDTTGTVYLGGLVHGPADRLSAVSHGNHLRWSVVVPGVDNPGAPIIGPDATTLYRGRSRLIALE